MVWSSLRAAAVAWGCKTARSRHVKVLARNGRVRRFPTKPDGPPTLPTNTEEYPTWARAGTTPPPRIKIAGARGLPHRRVLPAWQASRTNTPVPRGDCVSWNTTNFAEAQEALDSSPPTSPMRTKIGTYLDTDHSRAPPTHHPHCTSLQEPAPVLEYNQLPPRTSPSTITQQYCIFVNYQIRCREVCRGGAKVGTRRQHLTSVGRDRRPEHRASPVACGSAYRARRIPLGPENPPSV